MYVAAGRRLTHRGAKQMAATAVAKAEQAGIAITVAVADAGGHLIVLERMDGGRFHTVHSSTTKAVCAASNKRPTTAQGAQGQPLDVAHAIGLALAAGPEPVPFAVPAACTLLAWPLTPATCSLALRFSMRLFRESSSSCIRSCLRGLNSDTGLSSSMSWINVRER